MLRWTTLGLLATFMTALAWSQTPATLAPGTIIKAEATTDFDTANSQVGDLVSVTTSEDAKQGKFKLPKHSTFNGRVLKIVTAPDSESEASIALLFDSVTTPKGEKIPLRAVIASVLIKPPAASRSPFGSGGGGRHRGGYPGGGGGYPGGGGGGGGGYPGGGSSATPTVQHIVVRLPADVATAGSVIACQQGNFFIFPQTKLTLQIVASGASPE